MVLTLGKYPKASGTSVLWLGFGSVQCPLGSISTNLLVQPPHFTATIASKRGHATNSHSFIFGYLHLGLALFPSQLSITLNHPPDVGKNVATRIGQAFSG